MPPSSKPADGVGRRIAPLEVLPVFLTLAGRPAVVAGGSAAAAWKAELLAATGARVTVFAADIGDEMRLLLARGGAAGTLVRVDRCWTADDLDGAALAVCDTESEDEADAFTVAARASGVPVNVIDRPRHSSVTFGAIVNRSPVVVGISTGGAAPILGQAIRRRIESVLPTQLGAWAALAKRLRTRVAAWVPRAAARRRFWEALAGQAFTVLPPADTERAFADLSVAAAGPAGRVTLVGAGPGDAGLLTLKAVQALQAADVVLFDDLVSADVLELARREAERRCRRDEECGSLTLDLARRGKRVVHLTAEDPSAVDRDAGWLAQLVHCGVEVDIVPGVTSAAWQSTSLDDPESGRRTPPAPGAAVPRIASAASR